MSYTSSLYRGIHIRRLHAAGDAAIVDEVLSDCYRVSDLPIPTRNMLDIGAHIGTFTVLFKHRRPCAEAVAVEANRKNVPTLIRNIGSLATIIPAACTYAKSPTLLDSVLSGAVNCNTGGSIVVDGLASEVLTSYRNANEYQAKDGPLNAVTIEEIFDRMKWSELDVLKLDCEGSEFSILDNCQCLDRIGVIVGEWHDRSRFMDVCARKFSQWTLDILRDGRLGVFRLSQPNWWNMAHMKAKATRSADHARA